MFKSIVISRETHSEWGGMGVILHLISVVNQVCSYLVGLAQLTCVCMEGEGEVRVCQHVEV